MSNTGSGAKALYSNTMGSTNTATGAYALFSNTFGSSNTASGASALRNNTLGNNNVATGAYALQANSTGYANTANGTSALEINSSGNENTAIGMEALTNSNGNNNTALGLLAGASITAGSNNIMIGNQGTSSDDHAIRVGDVQTSTFIAGIRGATTGQSNAVTVVIDSNGQLGTVNSSRRFKEDIQDMGDASTNLMRLRPVTYRYKQPYADGLKPLDYGLIAEEVEEVYPDLVAKNNAGQIETVQYQKLTPMLLNELQKEHEKAQERDETIRLLRDRLAAVEAFLSGKGPTPTSGK